MAEAGHGVGQVAAILGVSERRVQQLETEGLFQKIGRGRYSLVQCVQAYIRYWQEKAEAKAKAPQAGTYDAARTRKADLEAERIELELAVERGELVTVAFFEEELERLLAPVRSALLNLPGRLAPRVAGMDAAAAMELIELEVDEMMRGLAGTDGDDGEEDDVVAG